MAVRIRSNGDIICAATSLPKSGDTYLDDDLHYKLSVELKVLVTDADHLIHGRWWWKHEIPKGIKVDEFYLE